MKVAIAGYGQEGEASLRYWQDLGAEIAVFDEKQPEREVPAGIQAYFGDDAYSRMEGFDLILRTAGLSPNKIKTSGKIWSATNEFFAKCPAKIIGVTGTKGKGTTCSLIAEILRAAGKTVHLVGNIGVPALEVLPKITPDDIVVFELSSFQLWDLKSSPETAVILMISPDHMDIHSSMAEYIDAKANIGAHQKKEDLLVYHPTNKYSAEAAVKSKAQKKRYLTQEGAYIQADKVYIEENEVCSVKEIGLVGPHNLENVCAAVTAAWNYTQDIAAIKQGVISFKGLPHRLELVREVNRVKYFNDSYASAPDATIAAVRAFTAPEILICGGFDRGLDYTELAKAISDQTNLKRVLLFGQTAHKIKDALVEANFENFEMMEEGAPLNESVARAASVAEAGDVVVFSPGCASFDMFKDFKDRGEQFKKAVGELI